MSSPLPYVNRLVYLIQTKKQCELPEDIIHDIETTLWNYGQEVAENEKKDKEYWQNKFFRGKGK
jgi:hypothetical protein